MALDSIRLAERRSLALHRRVAECLRAQPELLGAARRRVAGWLKGGHPSRPYLERWQALLERPLDEVLAAIVEDSEAARELRGATPFAGVVGPKERWRIWQEVRREVEAGQA